MDDSSVLDNIFVVADDINRVTTGRITAWHSEQNYMVLCCFLARGTRSCFVEDSDGDDSEDGCDKTKNSGAVEHKPCINNNCEKPLVDNILILTEDDIPGASLNGKSPNQLTVVQLKRWLTRGAPVSGKKADLVER